MKEMLCWLWKFWKKQSHAFLYSIMCLLTSLIQEHKQNILRDFKEREETGKTGKGRRNLPCEHKPLSFLFFPISFTFVHKQHWIIEMQPCSLTCGTYYMTECSKIQRKELLCLWMKPTRTKKKYWIHLFSLCGRDGERQGSSEVP